LLFELTNLDVNGKKRATKIILDLLDSQRVGILILQHVPLLPWNMRLSNNFKLNIFIELSNTVRGTTINF
jgi:hypothetical protein